MLKTASTAAKKQSRLPTQGWNAALFECLQGFCERHPAVQCQLRLGVEASIYSGKVSSTYAMRTLAFPPGSLCLCGLLGPNIPPRMRATHIGHVLSSCGTYLKAARLRAGCHLKIWPAYGLPIVPSRSKGHVSRIWDQNS